MAFDIKMPIQIAQNAAQKASPGYTIPEAGANKEAFYYPKVTISNDNHKSAVISWMGTPVLFPITFKADGLDKPYKVYKPSGELESVEMQNFILPAATVTDFSRAKNIITTDVLGGNGTVKELFGFDDWQIRIRGICLDDPKRKYAPTAQEQKEALMKWERIAGSIKVEGSQFSEKNIFEIVIQSINISQLEGKPWAIKFELNAMSNEPVSLIES